MDDATRAQRILRQHVVTDQLLGVDVVPVPEGLMRRSAAGPAARQGAPGRASGRPNPTQAPPRPARGPAQPAPTRAPMQRSAPPRPASPGPDVLSGPPGTLVEAGRDEKIRLLRELDLDQVQGCTKCGLCSGRTNTVFGEGNPDADLLFIGEGPGQNEDMQGRPFVGRAGELLDKMIVAMGLSREQVFIANVVKCRPPGNRAPTPDEAMTCWPYLKRQIEILGPKVIVTLGGPASKMICQTQDGITRMRGQWRAYEGVAPSIPVMPTFHPAYLLRSYTVDNRKKVWQDLQNVMGRLGTQGQ